MIGELRKLLKRMPHPLEIMQLWVRWHAAYSLSLRQIDEIMQEKGSLRPAVNGACCCEQR